MAGHVKRLLLVLAALLLAGCASRYQPLPDVSQPVSLRVAYLHNPGLPEPPTGFVDAVLLEAAMMMREHLGVDVRFVFGPRTAIEDAFGKLSTEQEAALDEAIFGYRKPGDRARLVAAMKAGIEKREFAQVLADARPWIAKEAAPANWDELASAMVDAQLRQLAGWKSQTGSVPYAHFPGCCSLPRRASGRSN
jgi:hypothetical protein